MEELLQELKILIAILHNQSAGKTVNDLEHLSIEEVASVLHCSPNTVRNLIREGAFKIFKYKGLVRVRKNDLERYINKWTK